MFLNGFEISIIIKTQKKSFFKSKFDSEMEHQLRHETQVGIPLFTVFESYKNVAFQFPNLAFSNKFFSVKIDLSGVTLFDRKIQVFKKSPKLTILGIFINFCPLKM